MARYSNLHLRILTACIGVPAVLALVYLVPSAGLRWVFLGLVVRTTFEFARLADAQLLGPTRKAWATRCILISAITYFTVTTTGDDHSAIAPLSAGLIAAAILGTLGQRSVQERTSGSLYALFVVAYPIMTWLALWFLAQESRDMLMLVLLSAWMSDTGAYFFGKKWGKHKMASLVSPNKTWEGAAAGFVFSIAGVFLFEMCRSPIDNPILLACIAPASAFAAQIGDLFKSIFKRQAGVKDAGKLLPGHGGLIDRIDSVLLSGTAVWVLLSLFRTF